MPNQEVQEQHRTVRVVLRLIGVGSVILLCVRDEVVF
jgi:hypothetical protein